MQEKYYLNRFINNQNNKRVSSVHLDKERYAPAFIVNRKKYTLHLMWKSSVFKNLICLLQYIKKQRTCRNSSHLWMSHLKVVCSSQIVCSLLGGNPCSVARRSRARLYMHGQMKQPSFITYCPCPGHCLSKKKKFPYISIKTKENMW